MQPLSDLTKQAGRYISANSTVILTAVGCAGVVATGVLAAFVTPEASRRVDDLRQEAYQMNRGEEPTKLQIVKATWMLYIPALAAGATTVACIVGAQSINVRRQAAALTAYSISDRAFREYKDKVVEHMGVKKERDVRDAIVADKVKADPVSTKEVILTGNGSVLCYEVMTGRYFESDQETLRKAQNDLNLEVINNQYATVNQFYEMIGLPKIKYGDQQGWTALNQLELVFSSHLSDDGRPCLAMDYTYAPITAFDDFH